MRRKKYNDGYAIVVVLILLVIGTMLLIMLNRESLFFSKVSGFFSRSRKIQSQAMDGIELAKGDLRVITANSRGTGSGTNTFTNLTSGNAFNQGLNCNYLQYCDAASAATRVIEPRISRTDGDYQLRVYYFPENPCNTSTSPCNNNDDYNRILPKRFLIVSEATNLANGEVFTAESRIQIKLENYAEISFGVLGAKCVENCGTANPTYFPNSSSYYMSPTTYEGRAYFAAPLDSSNKPKLKFILETGDVDNQNQQHIFKDLVTFKNSETGTNGLPFKTTEWDIWQQQVDGTYTGIGAIVRPMINFEKGYETGKELAVSDTDDSNPASDAYFSKMQQAATYNLGNDPVTPPCPTTPNAFGIKQVDVCLKFEGTSIKRYNCKKYNDDFMGRIDKNIHPASAYSTSNGFTQSTSGIFQPNTGIENTFPDRYEGEHAQVYTGTPAPVPSGASSLTLGNANGVIFCDRGSDCQCNVHIKGILDGQVNVVAQNVVIEGDLRYKNQNENSTNSLGVVAKNQIVIPAGIPQAATSSSSSQYSQQQKVAMQDSEPPFTQGPGGTPGNLAETYKDITNFIPYDSATGQYVDRNSNDPEYAAEYAKWNLSQTNNKAYGSPNALDLDGFFYAGDTVKVDGIFNPKVTGDPATDNTGETGFGMTFITCEDPPACNTYKYRNPSDKSDTDPNALYKADGTLKDAITSGAVQPLYYVDGLNTSNFYIGQDHDESTNANYNNTSFQPGEEVARPLNRVINVFGGMNSKFNFIYDNMTSATGHVFRMGFQRKRIKKNKSASYLAPPGYPSTASVRIDELYTKSQMGKSSLLPQ